MQVLNTQRGTPDEMSIVDVLTRLILDADSELQDFEQYVVESLGCLDQSLTGLSRREISEYLRAMGVDEMIAAVNSICRFMQQGNSFRHCGA